VPELSWWQLKKACKDIKIHLRHLHHFLWQSPQPEESKPFLQNHITIAPVAQWIEQWIPNPCAARSIRAGGTKNIKGLETASKHFLFEKLNLVHFGSTFFNEKNRLCGSPFDNKAACGSKNLKFD
jgi:hypothetical protein